MAHYQYLERIYRKCTKHNNKTFAIIIFIARYPDPVAAKQPPKMRPKSLMSNKPRPKTIHTDKDDMSMAALRNRRGSQNNISGKREI